MNRNINLDMDGVLASLYTVKNWLPRIRAYDPAPYREAKPMFNARKLTRLLNKAQKNGWKLRVVSWGSKDKDPYFLRAVDEAKREWLARYLPKVRFDEICVVAHGTPKSQVGLLRGGILFDDEEANRAEWVRSGLGLAVDEQSLMDVLEALG